MTSPLDQLLTQLGQSCGASAAVVWIAPKLMGDGTVVASWPAGLLASGTPWPHIDRPATEGIVRDPAEVAARVPATLGLRLPAPPRAAAVHVLGDGDLFLVLTWSDPPPGDELSTVQQQIIGEEISTLAEVVEGRRVAASETVRLRAVLDGLEVGVVSVDSLTGKARINRMAAHLLGLPGGEIPVSDFAAAMALLGTRALNHAETATVLARLHMDPDAAIDFMWRFDDKPTYIQVASSVVDGADLHGRVWVFLNDSVRVAEFEASEQARALLRATTDAMLDPQVLIGPVRDPRGHIVDFTYLEANPATCDYLGLGREELIGHRLMETLPNLDGSVLLAHFAHCAETGEPVVLDDFAYSNEILSAAKHYDIRAARAGAETISLTWRDVTARNQTARRVAESEERYRLIAENSTDAILHARDERVVWVSPSIEALLGAPAEFWVGHELSETVPAEDRPEYERRMKALAAGQTVQERIRLVAVDGVTHWVHLHARPFYDAQGRRDGFAAALRLIDQEVAIEKTVDEVRRRQAIADALYRRSMESAAVGMCLASPEGPFIEVNPAMCEFFGYDRQTLLTKTWIELTAPEYLEADLANVADLVAGRIESYQMEKQFIHADGHRIWGQLAVGCLRNPDGSVAMSIGQIVDVTDEVQAREALVRYQRLIDSSNIGINLVSPDGRVMSVNQAICDMFGVDAATVMTKTWQDMTPDRYLQKNMRVVEDLLAGRLDTYRDTQQYVHADGHLFWVDVSVSCLRDPTGKPEMLFTQMLDITDRVQAQQRLTADLDSAARYLRSILPGELSGPARVSSRYVPSQHLGGDCFDYRWLDGDHLIVYLLDVSGHGLEAALLAVSVHNLLRSGSLSNDTLLKPDQVLAELNSRFRMEDNDGHYFTAWYGVYQKSTRTMVYASAGHPPALALAGGQLTPLSTSTPPLGMFSDTTFTVAAYTVPHDSRILLYSDGAYEFRLPAGEFFTWEEFADLYTALAAAPHGSLDTLIEELHSLSGTGTFDDDCALVWLYVDGGEQPPPAN